METIFSKIIRKEIPADIIYEDTICMAFKDINPIAPTHVLLIPIKPIAALANVTQEDSEIIAHTMLKIPHITEILGIQDNFRIVSNNGEEACQTVFHLHFHILGGRKFTWPPG